MNDELITYGTAKSAKEKGFTLDILYYYEEGVFKGDDYYVGTLDEMYFNANGVNKRKELVSTPTQSLLQRWLREKHNIEVDIYRTSEMETGERYGCEGELWDIKLDTCEDLFNIYANTYELALEQGLIEALKLI